jgi:MerR family transcriptional regulator, copper efflux regulator
MRIGRVAAEAGVSVQAIRYYERRGLLPKPARRPSGYREYPASTVRQVRAIKWAQGLGFRLGQMSDLVGIGQNHVRGRRTRVQALVAAKLGELDRALQELQSVRTALQAIAAYRCDGDCPILEGAIGAPPANGRRSTRRPR